MSFSGNEINLLPRLHRNSCTSDNSKFGNSGSCQRRAETIYPTKLTNEKWMIISLIGSLLTYFIIASYTEERMILHDKKLCYL
jgi:hypothetical protein